MGQVGVEINGRAYSIACADGEEDRVRDLGRYVDKTVKELVGKVGQAGEARLLVLAALQITDELVDKIEENQRLGTIASDATGSRAAVDHARKSVETLADRIERIAASLEKA